MQNRYEKTTPQEIAAGQTLRACLQPIWRRHGAALKRHAATLAGPAGALLRLGERHLPATLRCQLLQSLLRSSFGKAAASGALDFLLDKAVTIEVPDLQMRYRLGLMLAANGRPQLWLGAPDAAPGAAPDGTAGGATSAAVRAEVLFRANSADLWLLLSQQADPDTLFFQRRLLVLGDTELGLYLKNYLDTLQLPALLRWD